MARVGPPLSPLQRVLLTTDGTVTHVLESYWDEPIHVVKLDQAQHATEVTIAAMKPAGPETVMRRTILLQGAQTKENYVYAESVILADRLAPRMAESLLTTDEPIGRLLIEARLETFREVLDCGREPAGDRRRHFGLDPSALLISRTYRVIAGHRPIMLITEKFPATAWLDGAQGRP
ncbi:MAG TPA: chorismate pyruvate-lyase family protein [Acidimicrobiales bacterium]|nr:chorismate pyruvate-lyase family protein [Acidimicrobiales bacterium]